MDTSEVVAKGRAGRPNYPIEFKRRLAVESCEPEISVAKLALRHGLNANMLRKWVNDAERAHGRDPAGSVELSRCAPVEPTTGFVPLQLPAPSATPEIRIEVKRAGTSISMNWPSSAAAECAMWLRELLR